MIFATVGTQLPFPRLAEYLEDIATKSDEECVFQSADPEWTSKAMKVRAFMTPDQFETAFCNARVVVGHAGIGTVLTARRLRKPLVIVPRRFALREHRNDHQMATANQLVKATDIAIATDLAQLQKALANPPEPLGDQTPPERTRLIHYVSRFLAD